MKTLILNDQGGSVMDISEDVTACLRAQDHGHPPVICAAFMGGQGARARTIAYRSDGTVPTLKSSPSGTNTVPDVVYCFEPGIAKREGSNGRFVQDRCVTLRAEMGDNQPAICFQQNQREEVRNRGEQAGALTAESGMHNTNYVCYAIEGNVVDRVSAKNGKGWCEDVSPTLNTQDRHAICFQLCGDRGNPSVSTSDIAYCIPANPMSDRGQAICYTK